MNDVDNSEPPHNAEHDAMARIILGLVSALVDVRGQLIHTRHALIALSKGQDHFAGIIADGMMESGEDVKKLISEVQGWVRLPR